MRKLAFLSLGVLALALSGCSKDTTEEPAPPAAPKTELELTVLDETNTPVQAASVHLYKTETDYMNKTNLVQGEKATDSFGKLTYSSLEPIKYWFHVESYDSVKDNDSTQNSVTLVKGTKTKILVHIK